MAAARGQKELGALPQLVKSLRSDPVSAFRLSGGPSRCTTRSTSSTASPKTSSDSSQAICYGRPSSCTCVAAVALLAAVTSLPGPIESGALLLYDDTGFKINNVKYEGSLLIVENKIMTWAPKTFSEITAESLSIFKVVHPIPEILILGCGRHIQLVSPELRKFIRSTGMKLEAVDSRNAASTYNILNEEGRPVAAAVLPYGVTC
ncbi:unnamed protein product [Miscanthus lutarioriparius]|uniref:NADH dehydrogenase [ubiquinone] 1 alpha subcomplex assembly factor 3 n=1 Tax=Miscanthus lutarioriparius TaxID=422564 RepID=A0A811MVY1_9POAL|nr:unnamed protein product [Miscanthus lutarioriparius]